MGSLHEPHISDTEYRNLYHFLNIKIKEWKKPHPSAQLFDSAVASLILATIRECEIINKDIIDGDKKKNKKNTYDAFGKTQR
jgi:hypothetical protein